MNLDLKTQQQQKKKLVKQRPIIFGKMKRMNENKASKASKAKWHRTSKITNFDTNKRKRGRSSAFLFPEVFGLEIQFIKNQLEFKVK